MRFRKLGGTKEDLYQHQILKGWQCIVDVGRVADGVDLAHMCSVF